VRLRAWFRIRRLRRLALAPIPAGGAVPQHAATDLDLELEAAGEGVAR
jgi:hypothetical protein